MHVIIVQMKAVCGSAREYALAFDHELCNRTGASLQAVAKIQAFQLQNSSANKRTVIKFHPRAGFTSTIIINWTLIPLILIVYESRVVVY
jgi:hypothetical protein